MAAKPGLNVVYKTVGNCDIDTDIYLPEIKSSHALTRPIIINVHGGGFMLGHSRMVNNDQIVDCLERGWIVVVPNHRLSPQVDIYAGPIQDVRDLLHWIRSGELDRSIATSGSELRSDLNSILAFGTSAGGTISLSLGFDVPHPVCAILDFYGPCNFTAPFWTETLPMSARLPTFPADFLQKVYEEDPVATRGGVSLEGQAQPAGGPNLKDPRQAFAMTTIANGRLLDLCFPSKDFKKIDALLNIGEAFPPTCIVHGQSDTMVPIDLSRILFEEMKRKSVNVEMIEVPGEEHTFAGKMVKGSQTWEIQRKGFDFLEAVLREKAAKKGDIQN